MKENNEKKKLVLILSCLGIILLLAGVSFSLVNFIFKGDREHVIDLNGLSFSYEEQKNGLSLTNLKPLNDTNGLASGNDYTFRVSATSKTAREVPYHIYLTVDNQNTLDSKYVRVNITNTTTNISAGPINIDKLRLKQNSNDDYYLMEDNFSFDGETPNLSNMYKLTIWVNEDYTRGDNYTVENNEQTTTYGGETFNFKISVATGKMPELDSTYANAPVLATNMIPVYYADGEWKKADKNNKDAANQWYDYSSKIWANAVTVTEVNGSRSDLVDAPVGTPVPMNRINTMWVWIPRFSATSSGSYNGGTQSNPGAFNITFVDNETNAHDAFTFGDAVSGFWIGKFENSIDTTCSISISLAVGEGCNLNTIRPKILPNATSWRGAMISTIFYDIQKMTLSENQYGFDKAIDATLDTHMLKNPEWGAVAYLTQSIYGRCTSSTSCSEVGINNNSSYITGYGAPAGSDWDEDGDNHPYVEPQTYNTVQGMDASTTGNIYGVYDMSGGAWDYVMGVYWDGTKLWSGYSNGGNSQLAPNQHSGFNGWLSEDNANYTGGVPYPSNDKYYNLYTTENDYTSAGLQHGMTETSGWYSDYAYFVSASSPWAGRGGDYALSSGAGVFNFYRSLGDAGMLYGSRAAVIIN